MVFAIEKPSEESWWLLKPRSGSDEGKISRDATNSGATIRLEHRLTRKNLHSHGNSKSPITRQQEVTAFGSFGVGDSNDDWIVELASGQELEVGARITLRHVGTGNVLHSHSGQSQNQYTDNEQEVTCNPKGDDNDIWEISEVNVSPDLAVGPIITAAGVKPESALSFYSISEALNWYTREKEAWLWLEQSRDPIGIINLWTGFRGSIENAFNEAVANRDSDDAKRFVDAISAAIDQVYAARKWPLSTDPRYHFVRQISNEYGSEVAACALAFLMRIQFPTRLTNELLQGSWLALNFERGIEGVTESEKQAFAQFVSAAQAERKEIQAAYSAFKKNADLALTNSAAALAKTLSTLQADCAKLIEKYKDELTLREQAWDKKNKDATEALNRLEETYRNKIAIESSVTYWKRKGRSNFALACIFVLSGFALAFQFYTFLLEIATALLNTEKFNLHDYWRIAALVFTVTVAIWICRLFVQLAFSNLHQWTDANERQTMIQTYLALKKDGYLPEGKDASAVLSVLFRPGDSGLLSGEKGPATPAELLVRVAEKRSAE